MGVVRATPSRPSRASTAERLPWVARIMVDGRKVELGYFATVRAAAKVYARAHQAREGALAPAPPFLIFMLTRIRL